ncbi:hypothetical protein A3770_03p20550 [Chloropicon primus]|uniref:Uncharacterized protein n=1 Tax=Chloropicon primus TaxID=1764295 RepID=A0A5B8MGL1_9CHLO|nr:hypothetical protein A3770_03p20550 [Chloropicon primus]|mmetsp:Transcript_12450/g.34635  ORF Transcript_12450/g.34635 Transcript_12450/m.34635 type:complete len:226 (+) Transcript_12450:376-1053(+)|eukprot:QDZ19537.1 hypothetical protein A3770_03p20550 [Chloropicon primus]
MKKELDPSLRLTGAKAISELRKLERRNSLDLEEEVAQQTDKRKARRRALTKGRVKAATTHFAPVAVPLSVKLLWDGSRGLGLALRGRVGEGSVGATGLLLLAAQAILGLAILLVLHAILRPRGAHQSYDGRGREGSAARSLLGGSFAKGRGNDLGVMTQKLKVIVLILFGEENMRRAYRRLNSHKEVHEMLSWICKVVGLSETDTMQKNEMLEKIEEVERVVGIQ